MVLMPDQAIFRLRSLDNALGLEMTKEENHSASSECFCDLAVLVTVQKDWPNMSLQRHL